MNLREIKRSRHNPVPGDFFYCMPPNTGCLWGRVISTTASVGGFDDCILIYVYDETTSSAENIPDVSPSRLLIPPIATNKRPWSMGYFAHVANQPLKKADVLAQHCFRSDWRDKYFDDQGRELKKRSEPCGVFGLDSFQTIDAKISEALGLPVAES